MGERVCTDCRDELVEDGEALAVERVGALLLPEADRDHLEEAALDRAGEVRVDLDAVDGDDEVGAFQGVSVDEDGNARTEDAELDRFHARADLAAHGLRGDPVLGEDAELALGGRAPVAAHRRDDEDGGARLADALDGRPDHLVDPVDPAAAGRDAHARSRPDRRDLRLERRPDRGANVADLGRVEPLANERPLGQRPGGELREGGPISGSPGPGSPAARPHDRRVAQATLAVPCPGATAARTVPAAAHPGAAFHQIVIALKPPSTRTIEPVTNPDALAEASQTAAPTSSSGSPSRADGVWPRIARTRSSERSFRFCSAGKKPGAIALTRMPCGASSRARYWVRLLRPAFATE